jgi:hypothetical protein
MRAFLHLPRRHGARAGAALVALGCSATAVVGLGAAPAAGSTPPAPTLSVVSRLPNVWLRWKESVAADTYVIRQATNSAMTTDVKTYSMRGPGRAFTPYGLALGTTYYYRVRAVVAGSRSPWSNSASFVNNTRAATLKAMSYNSLSAKADGSRHPGGVQAPFSQRRDPQLALMMNSGADVIGLQEGAGCIVKIPDKPCWRQVDSLAKGLSSKYQVADTRMVTPTRGDAYSGDYILYDSTVAPIGSGGTWMLGPSNYERRAVYQLFRQVRTGARFLFVDTHLITGPDQDDLMRGRETVNMLTYAKDYAQQVGVSSIIYVGDFNSYVGEWRTHDISGARMRSAGVPDGALVASKHVMANYDSINGLYRTPRRGHGSADHVYASGGIGVRSWGERLHLKDGQFAGTIPSDHNPVVSVLTLPY